MEISPQNLLKKCEKPEYSTTFEGCLKTDVFAAYQSHQVKKILRRCENKPLAMKAMKADSNVLKD